MRKWICTRGGMGLLGLAAWLLCACGGPATEHNPLEAYTSLPPASQPLPEQHGAPLEPLVRPGADTPLQPDPLLPGTAHIDNGSFEIWSLGRPHRWQVTQGAVAKAANAYEGDFAVALVREVKPKEHAEEDAASRMPPEIRRLFAKHGRVFEDEETETGPTEPARLVYGFQISDTVLGGHADASIAAKASAPGLLHLTLSYRSCFGEERSVTAVHPGSGEWETLAAELAIQRDADPATFELTLWRAAGTGGEAIVDHALLGLSGPAD